MNAEVIDYAMLKYDITRDRKRRRIHEPQMSSALGDPFGPLYRTLPGPDASHDPMPASRSISCTSC